MEESSFLNPGRVVSAAKITEGMHVADFGAGSGFFTRAAARVVGEEGVVWAVDVHQDLLSRIKNLGAVEGLNNIEVVHGNVEREGGSSLPPESFDFCIVANLLFATEDKEALLHEVHRILKRYGRALVVDWKDSFGGLGPHQDHVVSEQEARTLFEQNDFTFVEHIPAGAYHWGFVVRKKRE